MNRRLAETCSLVALLCIALASTGCGSGRLGAQEYVARGDRLCQQVLDTAARYGTPRVGTVIIARTEAVNRVTESVIRRFRRLRPPTYMERDANRLIALLARRVRLNRDLIGAARAGDFDRLTRAARARERLDVQLAIAGERAGFSNCKAPPEARPQG